jgi:signal transduction histidine kinase
VGDRSLVRSERDEIARQLHAGPIQSLTAAALRLQAALAFHEVSEQVVQDAVQELERAAAGIREVMRLLSEDTIEPAG